MPILNASPTLTPISVPSTPLLPNLGLGGDPTLRALGAPTAPTAYNPFDWASKPMQPTTNMLPVSGPAPVATAPNLDLSKSGKYFKVGNDVYESGTNRHVDLAEFQKLGLNFALLPNGSLPPSGGAAPLSGGAPAIGSGAPAASTTNPLVGPASSSVLANVSDPSVSGTPSTAPITIDLSGAINSTDVTKQGTFQDLQASIQQNQSLMQQQTAAQQGLVANAAQYIQPTASEKALQSEILGLQQAQTAAMQDVENRPLAGTVLTSGINSEIANISGGKTMQSLLNLREQTFATEKLQQEQQYRQDAFTQASFAITQGQNSIDNYQKMIDSQRANLQDFVTTYKDMTATAQTTLSTVLQQMRGLTWDQLSPDTAAQLATIAGRAGIPIGAIQDGMKLTKNEYQISQAKSQIDYQQQQAALDKTKAETANIPYTTMLNIQKDANALQLQIGSAFNSDPIIQRHTIVDGAYTTLLGQLGGDPNKLTSAQWAAIAGDPSRVNSIAAQWFKMQNPDSAKIADAAAAGDPLAAQSIIGQVQQTFGAKWNDLNVLPSILKQMVASAADNYATRLPEYQARVDYYNKIKDNSGILGKNLVLPQSITPAAGGVSINQGQLSSQIQQAMAIPGVSPEAVLQRVVQAYPSLVPQIQSGINALVSQGGMTQADAMAAVLQYLGKGNGGSTAARTDRHNNPTAFTTDVAKAAGLKEGVDYTVGDAFPDNPNLHTAQLIGDPVAKTIQVIDKLGLYTAAGKPRWEYVDQIPGAKNWSSLSNAQKTSFVQQMYQHEGGTALSSLFTSQNNA